MLLNAKETCGLLAVHKNTLYRMVKRGEIPPAYYTRIGKQYRFNGEAIEKFMLQKKTPPVGDVS